MSRRTATKGAKSDRLDSQLFGSVLGYVFRTSLTRCIQRSCARFLPIESLVGVAARAGEVMLTFCDLSVAFGMAISGTDGVQLILQIDT
jgi:hypothetical protein